MDDRPTLPFGEDARVPSLDLVLYSHRSLSPIGFWILMGLVAVVNFGAGIGFYAAGAWPVVGFLGLDVALIYVAFRMSYRSGRVFETIRMRSSDLVVRRTSARGTVKTWSFQPYWLRVELDEGHDRPGHLTLCSHGRRLVIGAFLAPEERREVAKALREALARAGAFNTQG